MNPAQWTLSTLESLNPEDLFQLTRRVIKTLGVCRLLLGRCLLTIDSTAAACEVGCSGAIHFAGLHGIDHREAREARRVARALEELPLLRKAAEACAINWSNLREVVSKATPETEARWLELAQNLTYAKLDRIVRATPVGEEPNETSDPAVEPVGTMLKVWLDPAEASVFQAVMRKLSEENGGPVSVKEHFWILWVQQLTGSYSEEAVRTVRDNADRDVAAQRPARVTVEGAPWAAVSAVEVECPGEPGLSLVRSAPIPHWTNERLRFNGDARGVTPAQRREILRRDGYQCATPGCPNHLWMEVHHVAFYCRGGATVPANLVVLCSRCHANVHEGMLNIRGSAPDAHRWTDRHGFVVGGVTSGESVDLLDTG